MTLSPATPPTNPRQSNAVKGGAAVAVLLMFVVGGALSYFRLAGGSQLRECERDMAANLSKYQSFRWERPVLRGQAVEGNSADAHRAVYAQLQGLPKEGVDDLAEVLRNLKPIPEETKAIIAANAPLLEQIRAATQHSYSSTQVDTSRGVMSELPSFLPYVRAWKLLTASARLSEPAKCLPMLIDTVRSAQDMTLGVGALGFAVLADVPTYVSPVFLACANEATPELRQKSRAELVKLVEHHPPFSNGALTQRIMLANTIKELTQTPLIPSNSEELKKILARQSAIEALDEVVHPRMADSDLLPEKYFSLSAALNAENKRWLDLKNPYLMDGHGSPFILYFHRDVLTVATLRALYLAVLALDEAPSSAAFLEELNSPKWADPHTGKAFQSGTDENTGTLRIFSYGHNGVEDRPHSAGNDDVIVVLPKKPAQ